MTHSVKLAVISILVLLCSCQPRGETKSVDQVLEYEKARFSTASSVSLAPDIKASLGKTQELLEELLSEWNTPALSKDAVGVAELLGTLVGHAGVTARPAFDEIIREYRALGELPPEADVKTESGRIRLLVSRTYGLLASELQSRGFSL